MAVVLALLVSPAAAQATTITVSSTADTLNGCTLRNAIKAANLDTPQGTCPAGQASPTVDTIDFSVPSGSMITLTGVLDVITEDVSISGPGQDRLTVSGADTYHPLRVGSGAVVSISGLTISHGKWSVACGCTGGAISNSGNLTLTGVTVSHSSVSHVFGVGGGIFNDGTMTIQNSTVSSNTVSASGGANQDLRGGGIYNDGTMSIVLSTVTGNTLSASGAANASSARGGGIFNDDAGNLTIDRSTIGSNAASADTLVGNLARANGGGTSNLHNLAIIRSTVSGNTVSASNSGGNVGEGGGVMNVGAANPGDVTVTIDRSTLSGNTVTESGGTSEAGGMGILAGTYAIKSSTFAHNSAGSGANLSLGGTPEFKNTIVTNPAGGGTNCVFPPPGMVSSYDLSSDASCGFTGTGDQQSTDPLLASSLGFNGGPTKTYALQPGSPAIDQGRASAGETIDQRGRQRPHDFPNIANASGGGGTDIGAFEAQAADTTITSGPKATTFDPTPAFTFKSSEPGSTFECKVDADAFAACTSPRTLSHLNDGPHTFQVRAKDVAGNPDPSPASRTFNVTTALVQRSGSTLVVTAAPSAKDNFRVSKPTPSTIRVTNLPAGAFTASGVHVGPGCTRSGDYTANCSASPITQLQLSSGTAADRVLNMTSLPSTILGGSSGDALAGGGAADTITGGTGADVLQGNSGNDTLLARDLASDTAIDCGAGAADKARADDPPKDSAVSGCETVTRH